jgi:hypothetical protein
MLILSCKKSNDLTKEEIYTIMNEIIADDSLQLYVVCATPSSFSISDEYGFNENDKKFIERQRKLFKDFKYDDNSLKSYSWKKKAFDFVEIDHKCDVGIINVLSFPLISEDRKSVVFENRQDCHCMLGDQSNTSMYIKENGHWKRKKVFDAWISMNTHK